MEYEKKSGGKLRPFVWLYFIVLILVLTIFGVMWQMGYLFTDTTTICLIFGLLICSAMIAGTVWLVRRMPNKALSTLMGCIGAALTFFAGTVLVVVASVMVNYGFPAYYTTLTSPAGDAVVVVRSFSADDELQAMRDGSETEDTLGIRYSAHPRVLRYFYNMKKAPEGMLEIGLHSEAELLFEWLDDDTLHLFIGDPEPGDVGELTLKLN